MSEFQQHEMLCAMCLACNNAKERNGGENFQIKEKKIVVFNGGSGCFLPTHRTIEKGEKG